MKPPPIIAEIEELLQITLHEAPAHGADPASRVMPDKEDQPHRYAVKDGRLAGLNLAGAKLDDDQWRKILQKIGTGTAHIEALNLRDNKLTASPLPGEMPKLRYLDLCGNQLREFALPPGTGELEYVWLYGNKTMTNPQEEIVALGREALLRHLRELQEAKPEDIRFLDEAKLIVVGQPRAGKTTLRYKLRDTEEDLPPEELTTRGIDIERLTFDFRDEENRERHFRYHVWDFGGQQIYHATHRFFLTKRTVYIAVVDTDVNERQNDLDYWLHMIELLGDGSPVVIVQNQKSNRSIEIEGTLRERFNKILPFKDYELNFAALKTKNKDQFSEKRLREFRQFKADIERMLERLPQPIMTKAKNDVRLALEKEAESVPVIEIGDYEDICIKNGLTEEVDQMDLLRTLHNLGVCLFYEEHDFLNRIVILQNRWATDAVFKILDDKTVKANKGHFHRRDLNKIWNAPEYCKRVGELVELMKKFKLCYEVEKTNEYIAPQLLDKNPPKGVNPTEFDDALHLIVEYDFMPRGIMTQFIVAMHPLIAGGQRHAWELGFVAEERKPPKARGMAKESYDSRKIELSANGPGAALLLQKMLTELDKINDSYSRLKVFRKIPCCCARCVQVASERKKMFDYEEVLLEVYQNRKSSMRCSRGNEEVPVEKLLGVLGFTESQLHGDYQRMIRSEDIHREEKRPEQAQPENLAASQSALQTIKIFLASSSELKDDRREFEIFISRENKNLVKKGLFLELVQWEDFPDAMTKEGLQKRYNEALKECEIFVSLFATKVGKYTKEEFETAFGQFTETSRPHIFTYFKKVLVDVDEMDDGDYESLNAFKKALQTLGHLRTTYANLGELKHHFGEQLKKLGYGS